MSSNKIALLTYSTKPRGGVAHTLSLAESLSKLGQLVHVYALATGSEFFRKVNVHHTLIPCPEVEYNSMDDKVTSYIEIYTNYLKQLTQEYDIFHAEDCISANALLNLREAGFIDHFVRTVHHIDDFTSQCLIDCQLKSIIAPDYVIAVSKFWERELCQNYSLNPVVINSGVSINKFTQNYHRKLDAKKKFGVDGSKVILSIGGIEPRKNTITALRAFSIACSKLKEKGEKLVWLIGGGETLFDYRDYRSEFFKEVQELGLTLDDDIVVLGNVSEEIMPVLYNSADVFIFPSVKEGWGLVVFEAMASSVPVIASGIEPITEYLVDQQNALLHSPMDFKALAEKILDVINDSELRMRLIDSGYRTASKYSWENTALKHIEFYDKILGEAADSNKDIRAVGK